MSKKMYLFALELPVSLKFKYSIQIQSHIVDFSNDRNVIIACVHFWCQNNQWGGFVWTRERLRHCRAHHCIRIITRRHLSIEQSIDLLYLTIGKYRGRY